MDPNEKKARKLTRRQFVKGAVAGTAAVVGAGAVAGLTPALAAPEAQASGLPQKWDEEADVVVVGFGGAGAVSAISATDAGAKVLILEKEPQNAHYPNTKLCGGASHYAKDPADAEAYFKALAFGIGMPKEMGDPPEAYPAYPKELVDDIVKQWGKGVCETADWMKKLDPTFEFTETIPSKDFPTFPGGKQYGDFSTKAKVGVVVNTGGQTLFKYLSDAVDKRKIPVLWQTPGKRLILNAAGEVVGVIADRQGKEIAVKAKRAVILTTGGFEYDAELKHAFLPGWKWVFMGNPGNTGDGVRMAMGAGAALAHMYHNAARVVLGAMVKEIGTGIRAPCDGASMVLVDNYGKRYANETYTSTSPQRYQFYNLVIQYDPTKLEYPRIPSWLIFDEKARKKGPIITTTYGAHAVGIYKWSQDNLAEVQKGWILKADTIEELAAKIAAQPDCMGKMDAKSLKATIDKFNQSCKEGKDAEFGRKTNLVGVDTPPFYAGAMYPGGPNTEGGPVRDAKGRVISVFGKPVPRLYAGGELGSVFAMAYQCGGNIGECIVFGRVAGESAAAEKPWDAV